MRELDWLILRKLYEKRSISKAAEALLIGAAIALGTALALGLTRMVTGGAL